jgi:hypothetical protein
METRGGNGIIEKKRSKKRVENNRVCWNAKHLAIGSKVAITFTIIFRV